MSTSIPIFKNVSVSRDTNIFETDDNLLKIEDIFQKWLFCKIFAFISKTHTSKKMTLLK